MKFSAANVLKILAAAVLILVFFFFFGWKIPVFYQISSLKLPKGAETVYGTKVMFSDVYEPHILGEKVIKCEEGLEAAEEYIKENNSAEKLESINICSYFGMTDDAVYFSDLDEKLDEASLPEEEKSRYIKIRYYEKTGYGIIYRFFD